jgi:hypothetical protein
MIDAAKGRWLNNVGWVVVILFICGVAMRSQGYIDDIQTAKKHTETHEERRLHYDTIITEQKVLNTTLQKDLEYLKKTMSRIEGELIRLKLVSIEADQPKKPNGS